MGTDGTRCMIFSSFTDTVPYDWVRMQLSDTGYRKIDIVCLGPVSLVLSSHCLLMARRLWQLYDIPYGMIDIVWLGPVSLIPGVDCLTIAFRLQFVFCRHCLSAAWCLNSLFTFFMGR